MTEPVTMSSGLPLGPRLKEARKDAKLTIAAIASEMGVDPRTVASWQAGRTRPSYERLVQLAALLGKPPSYFLEAVAGL